MVVGSFQSLNGLQWNRVPSILPMRTVSRKWSNPVHLLPFQLNKNNTTTHRVLIVKIQNQKSIKLSYNNIYYKTHSQLYIRPTINQWFQTCATFNNYYTVIVALLKSFAMFFSLVMFKCPFYYITELHKTKVSFLSWTFPNSKCKVNTRFNK